MRVEFGDVALHTWVEVLHEILTEPCCCISSQVHRRRNLQLICCWELVSYERMSISK